MKLIYDRHGEAGPDFYVEVPFKYRKDRHIMYMMIPDAVLELFEKNGYDTKTLTIEIKKKE